MMKGMANRQKRVVQPEHSMPREIIDFKKMNRALMKKLLAKAQENQKRKGKG